MSIDDLTKMDLTPLIIIGAVVAGIMLVIYNISYARVKSEYENTEEKVEYGLNVISKELGEKIAVGGTVGAPIMGYRCTVVFERGDGSRLVLKTSKAQIYERIVVGDTGDVKYKGQVLTDFLHITKQ